MISEKEISIKTETENEEKLLDEVSVENREIKLLEEEERLKSEMLHFEKKIENQEEMDLMILDETKNDKLEENDSILSETISSNETGKKGRANKLCFLINKNKVIRKYRKVPKTMINFEWREMCQKQLFCNETNRLQVFHSSIKNLQKYWISFFFSILSLLS